MTIEEAIKKAIEGGYAAKEEIIIRERSFIYKSSHKNVSFKDMLIDSKFWQSLGKAMGWVIYEDCFNCQSDKKQEEWLYHWHRFINHLAEGKDINSFFETL